MKAEQTGQFIFYAISKMWGHGSIMSYNVSTIEEINECPQNESGLYVLYFADNYPVYIGVTERSFCERLREHYYRGAIKKVFDGKLDISDIPNKILKVMLVNIGMGMQAKLMESVFLDSFDFCLNEKENGEVRLKVDATAQYKAEDIKHNFDINFGNAMDCITKVFNNYKHV